MKSITEALRSIWREVHNNPAWLSLLVERLSLDTEDEAYLNDLDDAFLRDMRGIERQWRKELRERVAWSRGGVDSEWAKERRKEYLAQEIGQLESEIETLSTTTETDCVIKAMNHLRIQELGKRKSRYSYELSALRQDRQGNTLETAQIERARAVPLEELVETRRGMMLCPLHDDTYPSMLVKNGFGYCFSCCRYLDSIGYLMRVRGLRFREAVETLQWR